VLRLLILPFSTILIFDFGIAPTLFYFLFFILLLWNVFPMYTVVSIFPW